MKRSTERKNINTNILAVDHGNANIKTQEQIFPASLDVTLTIPQLCNEWIKYKDKYYAISERAQPFIQNKTINENLLVTTLFALMKDYKKGFIDIKKPIVLAIGLPPGDITFLKAEYENYFLERFKDGLEFDYNNEHIKVDLDSMFVFIQDFAAVKAYSPHETLSATKFKPNEVLKNFDTYLAIDIGGLTVDYLLFQDGLPVRSVMGSLHLGTIKMASKIINQVAIDTTLRLDQRQVFDVLSGKRTSLSASVISTIRMMAEDWANDIINNIFTSGCDIRLYPLVFFGGGAVLLKDFLSKNQLLSENASFVTDINANARGYYWLAKNMQKAR